MARKRKLGPSSEGAGPSRPAKSRGLTSRFQENTMDSLILQMQNTIRTLQCQMEELQAKVSEQARELHILKNPTILENSIDENQTTREPANHGQYELKIMNNIKKRVYTGSEVEGQDGEILKVAICYNGQKITSEPLASARFEVVVLERNSSKFQEILVKGRPEMGSVLDKEFESQFSNGEAVLQGLKFKDNSSWAPGKKWWLGVRILEEFKDIKIKEAISGPFRVLDRHGKASEKPDIPLLDHGVDRLEKVGQERNLVLKKNGINTVKDFLQLYHVNPAKLLEILEMSKSDKQWKTMTTHAKKCDAGSDLYSYKWENTVLFFDSVYELLGAQFGNRYIPFDELPDSEKELVNKWKEGFYENIKDKSFPADFKLLNGQPVSIESNVTGNPTDGDASRHGPGLQHQPGSVSYVPASNPGDLLRPVSSVPDTDTDNRILLDLGNMESWDVGLLLDLLGEQPALVDTPSVQRNHRARGKWLVVRFVLLRQRRDPSVAKLKLERLILVARFLTKLKIAHSIAQLMTYLSGDPVAN